MGRTQRLVSCRYKVELGYPLVLQPTDQACVTPNMTECCTGRASRCSQLRLAAARAHRLSCRRQLPARTPWSFPRAASVLLQLSRSEPHVLMVDPHIATNSAPWRSQLLADHGVFASRVPLPVGTLVLLWPLATSVHDSSAVVPGRFARVDKQS